MKRISILFKIVLFTTSFLISGYLHADKPKAQGYYINAAGEKINVTIAIYTQLLSKTISVAAFQTGFQIYDKRGEKVSLGIKETEEFGFSYMEQKYVFRYVPKKEGLNVLGPLYDGAYCRLLIDGPCELYTVMVTRGGGSSTYLQEEHLLYKNKVDVYVTTTGLIAINTNKVSLEKFFSDCPELSTRIKEKEFKKGDDKYQRMITVYNKSCRWGETEKVEEKEEETSEE